MNTKGLLRKKLREGTTNGIIYLFLLLMSVVWIFPFVYLIVTSFRGESTGIVAYFSRSNGRFPTTSICLPERTATLPAGI